MSAVENEYISWIAVSFSVLKMAEKMKLPLWNCIHLNWVCWSKIIRLWIPVFLLFPIFLEQNILLKFYVGISVYMCIFLYLTMSYGKCLYLHNVDMTFRIIMLILSILWEKKQWHTECWLCTRTINPTQRSSGVNINVHAC